MKVAIIGRTQILYETTLKLLESGHQVCGIITAKATPEYSRNEKDFKNLAEKLNVPYFQTNNLNKPEIEEFCKGLDIGVSINWVSVIKQNHIDLFRLGILNSHLGDLPRYRGNACSNWAIINNEDKIVNSIHFMEGGQLDCGRIICQETFYLNETNSISDVYKWAEKLTPILFHKALELLEINDKFALKFAEINSIESFRCFPRLPQDNFINWDNSVREIHNLIRAACWPFSGAYTFQLYEGEVKKLIVLKSRIVLQKHCNFAVPGHVLENNKETGESLIQCGDGIIALLLCRYDDEQEEFLPGSRWSSIRIRLGVRLEDWLWTIYQKCLS